MNKGAHFHLEHISEEKRLRNLRLIVGRGNHGEKNDSGAIQYFKEIIEKELHLRHIIILSLEAATSIPNLEVCPLGIVKQQTVDELGERKEKIRIVHDLSFSIDEDNSINSRMKLEDYLEVQYGRTLMRILYCIHHFRARKPIQRILLMKLDCDNAYQRIHLSSNTIFKIAFMIERFLFFFRGRLSWGLFSTGFLVFGEKASNCGLQDLVFWLFQVDEGLDLRCAFLASLSALEDRFW